MAKRIGAEGSFAVAEAVRLADTDVVAAYPITPQTPIVEQFAKFVADGVVDTEMVPVESEHSAMSATVGAEAAGARAMSATSSQGLALMWEIVAATPGLRLPVVMSLVNRTLSAPLNIHCDHSDVMGVTTLGWIQIFSENAQEVYENLLLAVRVAEGPRIQLPAMVNQDGFITSHAVEPVEIFEDDAVRRYVGVRSMERALLDLKHVETIGAMVLPDYLLEVKRAQEEAMSHVFEVYAEAGRELTAITGHAYPFFETYKTEDADAVIVVLNSAAGTAKVAVDAMRARGKKVGVLKPILFRPFPYAAVRDVLKNVPVVGVLDRSMDFGAYAPVYSEIRNVLYDMDKRPATQSYIYGLGGRDIMSTEVESVFDELLSGTVDPEHQRYVGLRG